MPLPTSRPACPLTPETHVRIKALAARWRATPTLQRMNITHDMLIGFALPLLEAAIPWSEFTGTDQGRDFAACAQVMEMVARAKEAV